MNKRVRAPALLEAQVSDPVTLREQTEAEKLRVVLVARYADLRTRLARRLGSLDSAEDALQDTYVRLQAAKPNGQPGNPVAYLFQAALNIAINQRRAEARRLTTSEIEALLHIADDAPDALKIIESRADLAKLKQVMAELPPRQRAILLAARLDGLSRKELAERFGISVSMIEKELRAAQIKCVARFRRRS
ncbi:RNA polymerase sigma factor [Hyphomicrobium sp. 2TAF46]|uniref:RNA polymerase sigma factor n=1 Tax=Hyphomicrobium sp. 2TAF46 TaxID=3233019 RepID=UPI003F931F35